MILLSHAVTDPAVRHTARALRRAGVLGEFWTYLREAEGLVIRNVTAAFGGEPQAAIPAAAPAATGVAEMETGTLGDYRLPTARAMLDPFAQTLDRQMSERIERERFAGVYAFLQGADASFRAAGRRGLLRIYDLHLDEWPGRHPVLDEEAVREPEWAATLDCAPGAPHVPARHESEARQADLVLVGSTFGLQALEQTTELSGATALIPPAITSPPAEPTPIAATPAATDKLRLLFVGALGQRAGLSYLFRACHAAESAVTLTVIGRPPAVWCRALQRELRAVRWLPACTGEELRREMAAHDVFVYPSIFDNGSHLLLQALAMGLPVVASDHSAAPDIITDGVEGFIVPARSVDALVARFDCLRRDRDRRAGMSRDARLRATSHSWEHYEHTLAAVVAAALGRR